MRWESLPGRLALLKKPKGDSGLTHTAQVLL